MVLPLRWKQHKFVRMRSYFLWKITEKECMILQVHLREHGSDIQRELSKMLSYKGHAAITYQVYKLVSKTIQLFMILSFILIWPAVQSVYIPARKNGFAGYMYIARILITLLSKAGYRLSISIKASFVDSSPKLFSIFININQNHLCDGQVGFPRDKNTLMYEQLLAVRDYPGIINQLMKSILGQQGNGLLFQET